MGNTKQAVIYTRVGKRKQKDLGFSITAQLNLLRKYATDKNIEVVKEYQDVCSAVKENRHSLQKLLSYLKANNVKDVLVYSLDRLTRNLSDLAVIKQADITIHAVNNNSVIYPNELNLFAENFNKYCSEREIEEEELKISNELEESEEFYEADEFVI